MSITFSNRLPDPNYSIEETGKGGSGTAGPGFASVRLDSIQPTAVSTTNSGRVTSRSIMAHKWQISINYNPMTREQFEPVFNFLMEKRGRLKPFEVVLPQYSAPRTALSITGGQTHLKPAANITAGAPYFLATNHGDTSSPYTGGMRPGDMFTFNDTGNSNHKKVYRVTSVTDRDNYIAGLQPATAERYYYVTPSIEKAVTASTTTLITTNPVFRVMQSGDTVSYSLGTNNLYEFNLSLIEAQP